MQVKDVGFVQAASEILKLEVNAGLKDVDYRRVHTYKVSGLGLRQKKQVKAMIEDNQKKLRVWAGKRGRDESMVVLARSIYITNNRMIEVCDKHIETIGYYLAARGRDV